MKKIRKIVLAPVMAVTALLAMNSAIAGSAESTLNVSAEVVASCNLTIPSDLDLSAYNPTEDTATSINMVVICSKGVAYNVGADKGLNGVNVSSRALMSAFGDPLNYELKLSGSNWGDVAGSMKTGVGTGTPEVFSPVLRVPQSQFVKPGVYTDTVTISLTY